MAGKVLVTGGAGYIGSHVVKELGKAGYDIVVYDNCSTGHPQAVLYGELVIGDLADRNRLAATFTQHKITAVFHFAARTSAPESVQHPLEYYSNNTCNTLTLLQLCQRFAVKQFIFSSTAAVYGEPEQNPVSETAPTLPINPYGRSKLMSEWLIQDYAAASEMRYVILRYFNVAGADPGGQIGSFSRQASHLIKIACDAALGDRLGVNIYGTDFNTPDGTGVRDYIHVSDLADAHLKALQYLENGGESKILNCGYGQGYSVRQVLEMVKRLSGVDFSVVESERRPGDPACVVAHSNLIQQFLGWKPQYNHLQTLVQTTLDWEKSLHRGTSLPQHQTVKSQTSLSVSRDQGLNSS
uniref:UDP-glucose 4-epimerase n=1 Tax=Cyanothece sp. (strain PCC 7425 / ATCC 29141) TaxID=395961 RepID=B8HTN3_CYAP4